MASGSGSNAEAIAKYFRGHADVEVDCIVSNKPSAFVLKRAEKLEIDHWYFDRKDFYQTNKLTDQLKSRNIHFVILAGFLWLIPKEFIAAYTDRIINIHPSLLPKYGGKGMYGGHVHEAVIANNEKESGITIHLVDEIYDNGKILKQVKVIVSRDDTPDTLASKIHAIEHKYFPPTIESYVLGEGRQLIGN